MPYSLALQWLQYHHGLRLLTQYGVVPFKTKKSGLMVPQVCILVIGGAAVISIQLTQMEKKKNSC